MNFTIVDKQEDTLIINNTNNKNDLIHKESVSAIDRRHRRLKLLEGRSLKLDDAYSCEFIAHDSFLGLIIGKQGDKLNQVAKTHKVEIWVFPADKNLRKVRIYGTSQSSINKARLDLEYLFTEFPISENSIEYFKNNNSEVIKEIAQRANLHSAWYNEKTLSLVMCGTQPSIKNAINTIKLFQENRLKNSFLTSNNPPFDNNLLSNYKKTLQLQSQSLFLNQSSFIEDSNSNLSVEKEKGHTQYIQRNKNLKKNSSYINPQQIIFNQPIQSSILSHTPITCFKQVPNNQGFSLKDSYTSSDTHRSQSLSSIYMSPINENISIRSLNQTSGIDSENFISAESINFKFNKEFKSKQNEMFSSTKNNLYKQIEDGNYNNYTNQYHKYSHYNPLRQTNSQSNQSYINPGFRSRPSANFQLHFPLPQVSHSPLIYSTTKNSKK